LVSFTCLHFYSKVQHILSTNYHFYSKVQHILSFSRQFPMQVIGSPATSIANCCYLSLTIIDSVVPKLLWICSRVKVEVINNKTTWVRVKSTGSKTYLSKKYKVSLKILEVQSKSTVVCSRGVQIRSESDPIGFVRISEPKYSYRIGLIKLIRNRIGLRYPK
jgi:hypothetical protein